MECVIKDKACYKLNDRTCCSHTEEQNEEIILERFEYPDGCIKAKSVNRTQRTCKEASVDELAFGDAIIDNFDYPSHEAVNKEHSFNGNTLWYQRLEATKDGLVQIIALIKDANDEYKQFVYTTTDGSTPVNLIAYVAKSVLGTTVVKVGDREIDLGKPFARKSIVDLVKEYAGIDLMQANTLEEAIAMAKSANQCWKYWRHRFRNIDW